MNLRILPACLVILFPPGAAVLPFEGVASASEQEQAEETGTDPPKERDGARVEREENADPALRPNKPSVSRLIETGESRTAPIRSDETLHTQLFKIPAPRGLILDRYGNPLAQTRAAEYLALNLQALKSSGSLDEGLAAIREALSGTPELQGLAFSVADLTKHWKHRPQVPFPLSQPLAPEAADNLRLLAEASDLFDLETIYLREYPSGTSCGHIAGYASPSMPFQHGPLSDPENLWPPSRGAYGLEDAFDEPLSGKDGLASYVYTESGRLQDVELVEEPVPGDILEEVPPHLIDALIATEDNRFFEHNGFDPRGIARAALANLKAAGIVQGGSTITQQLARHAFDLSGRTLNRKMAELFLAQRIEERYTKDGILEAYLNRIYLGAGFWGVGSASFGYFGKHVSELTVAEAATLCALIKSPNRFSPYNDPHEATLARDRTLDRMVLLEMIPEDQAEAIKSTQVEPLSKAEREKRPHYLLAAVRREALDILGQYHNLQELEISTSVDLDLQTRAASTIDQQLRRLENREDFPHDRKAVPGGSAWEQSSYLQGALVVIENRTGHVLAAVGGRDYVDSQFDRVWQSRRNPGTALVPFLYAEAFESGELAPFSPVLDAPLDNRKVMLGGTKGVLGEWGTESLDNDYEGEIPAAYALATGKNGVAVRVGEEIGTDRFGTLLSRAGISSELNGYPSSFLGQTPLNFLELVHAYSVFPNLGKRTEKTRLITRIEDKDGRSIYEAGETDATIEVIGEETASLLNSILGKTFEIDPVRRRAHGIGEGYAGKAGTSYDFTDNWFIGYNADHTWGVWIGLDAPQTIYENAFSSETALPVWLSLASALGADSPLPTSFDGTTPTCLLTGLRANEFCRLTGKGDLTVSLPVEETGIDSTEVCDVHQSGAEDSDSEALPEPELEPDLFTSFTPVKPKVDIVVGKNPWSANPSPANQ
ncbi:MAG: transglycosylase domain-containing protein [Verrucomicrobiales bacterium]